MAEYFVRVMDDADRGHFRAMTCEEMCAHLAVAIRLTQEYVGRETLPPLPGWSWYDALCAYDEWRTPREEESPASQSSERRFALIDGAQIVDTVKGRSVSLSSRAALFIVDLLNEHADAYDEAVDVVARPNPSRST